MATTATNKRRGAHQPLRIGTVKLKSAPTSTQQILETLSAEETKHLMRRLARSGHRCAFCRKRPSVCYRGFGEMDRRCLEDGLEVEIVHLCCNKCAKVIDEIIEG